MSDISAIMAQAEQATNAWRAEHPELATTIDEQRSFLLVEQAVFSVWMEGTNSGFPTASDIARWIAESYQLPEQYARRLVFQKLCESPPWLSYRTPDDSIERSDVLDGVEIILSKNMAGLFMASRLHGKALTAAIAILEENDTDISHLEPAAIETARRFLGRIEGAMP